VHLGHVVRRERATQRVDGFRNANVQFHPPDALAAATFGDGPDRILRPGAGEDLPGAIILPRREEMSRQLEAEATVRARHDHDFARHRSDVAVSSEVGAHIAAVPVTC